MLVKPFLPTGGTGILFGRGGTGKTQIALSLTKAILEGGFFLSRFRCRRGRVSYVQVDTPPQLFADRLHRLAATTEERAGFQPVIYDTSIDSIAAAASPKPPQWALDIRDHHPDLVIVDSLRKVNPLDENDNKTPSQILAAWRRLVGNRPAILFLHHANKQGWNEDVPDEDLIRGASAWTDDMDLGMFLREKAGKVTLSWTKHRSCEEPKSMYVEMNKETLLMQSGDRARVRALALLGVGVEKAEAAKLLVTESLCSDKVTAYKILDEAADLLTDPPESATL